MPPPIRRKLRVLDAESHGIDKLVFQVDVVDDYNAEAFVLVGLDGQPLGTPTNPLSITGGAGGASGPLDVTDRSNRQLGHTNVDNFPSDWDIRDRLARVLGHVLIDNASLAVTGTFWQPTQPVSGPLTDAQLRAAALAVLGPLTDTQLRATPVPVSGTFWQTTQPVSGPLTDAQLRAAAFPVTANQGTAAAANPWLVEDRRYNALRVTATGAAGAAVTATLPAVVGQFHYIETLEITAYTTVARTGTATPIVVTSTNLPGNPAWTFATAAAIGTTDRTVEQPTHPIRSAAVNTPTTIVCPATPGVIWRINVAYWTGS